MSRVSILRTSAVAALAVAAVGVAALTDSATVTVPGTCDRNATTATFAAQVAAATPGQTICLASGSYGTWTGTAKASPGITIKANAGQTPAMNVDLNTGDNGFVLDGFTGMAGSSILNGAHDVAIKNSDFSGGGIEIDGPTNANILLDHNSFHDFTTACPPGGNPAYVHLSYGGSVHSGVTVSNSTFTNGDADGIQAGLPVDIINNTFDNLRDRELVCGGSDSNHTDDVQLFCGCASSSTAFTTIRGNWFKANNHVVSAISAFDGTDHVLIESNVVQCDCQQGITLYSDVSSTIRHNTVLGQQGASIYLDKKTGQPNNTGTVIRDNVATVGVGINNATSITNSTNLIPGAAAPNIAGTPTFVGGATPTTYAGFRLTALSAGHLAASDGLDVGIQ